MFEGKKVLVTGGTGLIGTPLVKLLIGRGALLRVVSLDDNAEIPEGVEFKKLNLLYIENCLEACKEMDYVFHLAGIKGSPKMCIEKPASFFVPTITFNTNMMEAARASGVKKYLYTSTVGVYAPADVFYEDSVWSTFPSDKDKFAGWAKRMGELQAEAYKIEFNWDEISIVRPANVYGPFDNFDPENAMVIPSLISRIFSGESPLKVWGDGSAIRDFIFSEDVARGMIFAVENNITEPLNLGCGDGVSIKDLVEIIVEVADPSLKIFWDIDRPSGDHKRILSTEKAKAYGFNVSTSLKDGIQKTIDWYLKNKKLTNKSYNVFTEKNFYNQ